jgi:hypothetical protein
MLGPIPSLAAALGSDDDGRLEAELCLGRLRSQAAVIRALADHVEHLSRAGDGDGIGDQLIEEMARLGCRLIEAAGSLAGSHPEDSGVFARRPFAMPVLTRNPVRPPPVVLTDTHASSV